MAKLIKQTVVGFTVIGLGICAVVAFKAGWISQGAMDEIGTILTNAAKEARA